MQKSITYGSVWKIMRSRSVTRNPWLLGASALMFLTFLAHVFVGGTDIYMPLRKSGLALEPKATLSVVWHTISLFLVLFAGALLYLSRQYERALACLIGLSQVGFATIFFAFSLIDSGTIAFLPQWSMFALIAVFMWLGHRKQVS